MGCGRDVGALAGCFFWADLVLLGYVNRGNVAKTMLDFVFGFLAARRCRRVEADWRGLARERLSFFAVIVILCASGGTRGGLIGYWRLDEGSGANVAADSGPRGHDGVYRGTPGLDAAGAVGTGMDSSGGYMTADLGADLPVGSEVRTVVVFIKPSVSENRKFFGYGDTPPGSAFEFTTEEYQGEMGVRFRHWGGNYHFGGIAIGEWNHVAMRVPSGAVNVGDVDVFIDGEEIAGVRSGGSNVALVTAASLVHVGTAAVGEESGRPFEGVIDEVQFYDEALGDDEIEYLYDNPGQIIVPEPTAVGPSPANGAWRVELDSVLRWEVAYVEGFTPKYNVYFGTDSGDLPLKSFEQSEKFYDPAGDLEAGAMYYWRVDVVEPGPPPSVVYPGRGWSFMSWYESLEVVEWKLEGEWEFEGDSYTSDSSGQGNDGRLYDFAEPAGPNWTTGIVGDCLEFGGGEGYVANEDAVNFPLGDSDEWTMNLYLQLDERTPDWTRIAGFGDPWRRELITWREGEVGFVYEGKYLMVCEFRAGVGVWRMVTATCDANSVKIFVDGIEQVSRALPFSEADEIDDEINLLSYANGEMFAGRIDEFTVWDGALSAGRIASLAGRLPKRGDYDGDNKIGPADLDVFAGQWLWDTRVDAGQIVLDDMEDYEGPGDPCLAALWRGYEGYAGSNAISLVVDAGGSHGGGQAVRWDYDFGVGRVVGFDYWLRGGEVDLSIYDELHLWVYREAPSTGGRLWCKLLDRGDGGEVTDMGEKWCAGGVEGLAEGEWVEWAIDLRGIHSWESSSSMIVYDRIKNLVGLSIGSFSEAGGVGAIRFDDLHLVGGRGRCMREGVAAADSNGDCLVDFGDFAFWARDWLAQID